MTRLSKFFEKTFGLAIVVITVFAVYAGLGFTLYKHYFIKNPTFAGTFGDMFGGITSLFSAVTVIIVYWAARLQKEELDATRQELKSQVQSAKDLSETADKQNKNLILQRFETTLFKLIEIQQSVIVEVKAIKTENIFANAESDLRSTFHHSGAKYYIFHSQDYGDFIDRYTKNKKTSLDPLFKHMANTIEYIKRSAISDDTRKFYLKIYTSIIPPNQLKLLYFYIAFDKDVNNSQADLQRFCHQYEIFKDVPPTPHESYKDLLASR